MIGRPRPRPRDDPSPLTVTAALYGGPHDGETRPVQRLVGESPPSQLDGLPGYLLLSLDKAARSETWWYGWQASHTGHRRPCSKAECEPGCPTGRPLTPRPLSP